MLCIATFHEKVKQIIHKCIIVAGMRFLDQLRTHVMEFILNVQRQIHPSPLIQLNGLGGGGRGRKNRIYSQLESTFNRYNSKHILIIFDQNKKENLIKIPQERKVKDLISFCNRYEQKACLPYCKHEAHLHAFLCRSVRDEKVKITLWFKN